MTSVLNEVRRVRPPDAPTEGDPDLSAALYTRSRTWRWTPDPPKREGIPGWYCIRPKGNRGNRAIVHITRPVRAEEFTDTEFSNRHVVWPLEPSEEDDGPRWNGQFEALPIDPDEKMKLRWVLLVGTCIGFAIGVFAMLAMRLLSVGGSCFG